MAGRVSPPRLRTQGVIVLQRTSTFYVPYFTEWFLNLKQVVKYNSS
jgi:hypothetical protein